MKLILSHPIGNENVKGAALGFQEAGILTDFYTAIACFPGSFLDKVSNIKGLSEIRRRSFNKALQPYTHSLPMMEIGRLISLKAGLKKLSQHETGVLCTDATLKYFDKKVASRLKAHSRNGVDALYAYEDAAVYSFREARQQGLATIYDLPIGYWRAARRLMENENERWPEWVPTLTGFKDSAAKLAIKDEEIRLADRIFVASTFTKDTLAYYPGLLPPVHVIPYGFPAVAEAKEYISADKKPLKLLFVGGLSQRKGIADLFAAVAAIGPRVELTVVGTKTTAHCAALDLALSRHRWIPSLPHQQVLALMRQHDVLVFPSLFEGFGLVITEAMAQGTPVITTDRTAGPDIINNGENGWLIPAGSTLKLQEAIEKLLLNRKFIAEVGRAAQETARKRPWAVYGRELAVAVIADK